MLSERSQTIYYMINILENANSSLVAESRLMVVWERRSGVKN